MKVVSNRTRILRQQHVQSIVGISADTNDSHAILQNIVRTLKHMSILRAELEMCEVNIQQWLRANKKVTAREGVAAHG